MFLDIFKKAFKKKEANREPVTAGSASTAQAVAVAEAAAKPAEPPAAPAAGKELDEKELERQFDEELSKLGPGILSKIKDPAIRKKIVDLAKKMMKSGVDLKNEKQIKEWLKKHPDEIQKPGIGAEEHKIETFRREVPKVGRNDVCPCGSGKKYKKCCGAGAE